MGPVFKLNVFMIIAAAILVSWKIPDLLTYNIGNVINSKEILIEIDHETRTRFYENLLIGNGCEWMLQQTTCNQTLDRLFSYQELVACSSPNSPRICRSETVSGKPSRIEPLRDDSLPEARIANAAFFDGLELRMSGDESASIENWRIAPEIAAFFVNLGAYELYQAKDYSKAQEALSIASAIDPLLCEASYYNALSLINQVQPSEALEILLSTDISKCREGIRANIYFQRAKILSEAGEYPRAKQEIAEAIILDPSNPQNYLVHADILINTGATHDEIATELNRALDLAPDNIWVYVKLCNFERDEGNLETAIEWCEMAVDSFPQDYLGFHYLGITFLADGKYQNAITSLKKATELNSNSINSWLRLGEAYQNSGDITSALFTYESALKIEPGNKQIQQRIDAIR